MFLVRKIDPKYHGGVQDYHCTHGRGRPIPVNTEEWHVAFVAFDAGEDKFGPTSFPATASQPVLTCALLVEPPFHQDTFEVAADARREDTR
jgi:hypothetical protein